jgi:hypothetical protein
MRKLGSLLTGLAGIAFLATAALHATGYPWILAQAESMSAEAALVVPPLWLMFAADLGVLGLVLITVSLRPARGGPFIVLLAALAPLTAAGLLARTIRLGGPVPILAGVAGLAILAAAVLAIQVRINRPARATDLNVEGPNP